jgi:hypothetical protein
MSIWSSENVKICKHQTPQDPTEQARLVKIDCPKRTKSIWTVHQWHRNPPFATITQLKSTQNKWNMKYPKTEMYKTLLTVWHTSVWLLRWSKLSQDVSSNHRGECQQSKRCDYQCRQPEPLNIATKSPKYKNPNKPKVKNSYTLTTQSPGQAARGRTSRTQPTHRMKAL